jgi:hypothetical protein
LWRVATSAPMYNAVLTVALPPHTARLPRKAPDSLLSGATPTKAASCLGGRLPSSGSSAKSVLATTGFPLGDRPRSRADGLGEAREDLSVYTIGLGQPTRGSGEVACLPGVTTAIGSPAAAKAAATGRSNAP